LARVDGLEGLDPAGLHVGVVSTYLEMSTQVLHTLRCHFMGAEVAGGGQSDLGPDSIVRGVIVVIEYAIITSLLLVAGIVLVRTVVEFLGDWSAFPQTIVAAIDGILVVIILLDIAHTVFGHLRASVFPVRPFLVIGILAGVRDILSASARLTLSGSLSQSEFQNTLIALGVGVGAVVLLLVGLFILRYSEPDPQAEAS
jgi:uncharacterized membrane protein (DUF373 family)